MQNSRQVSAEASRLLKIVNKCATIKEAGAFMSKDLKSIVHFLLKSANFLTDGKVRGMFSKALSKLKTRIHPAQRDKDCMALASRVDDAHGMEKRSLAAEYILRLSALMESPAGRKFTEVVGAIDQAWAPVAKLDYGAGRSNRARRAKPATQVLSQYAGLNKISGAKTDKDGNALGEEFDLGLSGAFSNLRIVVLQQYTFSFDRPLAALRDKGFEVDQMATNVSAEALDESLENASQFWLISSAARKLSAAHFTVIIKHWKKGLGLYIFGDNRPFFVDANRLLDALAVELEMKTPLLSGNNPGGRIVHQRGSNSRGGFSPHLLTTGLTALFEGITVAHMDKATALNAGFEEILRDHDDALIAVARPTDKLGRGPVIVDGAFTKLYCHWNIGGSARFVRNCACWLSTNLLETEPAPPPPPPKSAGALCMEGAFEGECSITFERGPLALLATRLSDPDMNTTDFALDNNLSLGRNNHGVLCVQPLLLRTAKLFLQQGQDPFTRRPVVCVVPLVSLKHETNLRIVNEVANSLFMGGRSMNRHSFNILLSVCEEKLHTCLDKTESAALRFLIDNILRYAVSTPDMLKGVTGGPTVPLIQGLATNLTLPDEMVPLRKAFAHVGLATRLLADTPAGKSMDIDKSTLRKVARRSVFKTIVGAAIKVGKIDGGDGRKLRDMLNSLLFRTIHGVPIGGTAKIVSYRHLKHLIEAGVATTQPKILFDDMARVAKAVHTDRLLSNAEVTELMHKLWERTSWRVMVEPLIRCLVREPSMKRIWNRTTAVKRPPVSAATKAQETKAKVATTTKTKTKSKTKADVSPPKTPEGLAVKAAMEKSLCGRFACEPVDHQKFPWPGFVSPLGPSVYRCKCGVTFGDPNVEVTEHVAEKIKAARNKHFRQVFQADCNGYPTNSSVHFPLHRAVQYVLLRPAFKGETERQPSMEQAVAQYLLKRSKGNIHVHTLGNDIAFALDTYLSCRRRGLSEPKSLNVCFVQKTRVERELILKAREDSCGKRLWVNPVRPIKRS